VMLAVDGVFEALETDTARDAIVDYILDNIVRHDIENEYKAEIRIKLEPNGQLVVSVDRFVVFECYIGEKRR